MTPMMSGSPCSLSMSFASSVGFGLSTRMSKSRWVSCLRTSTFLRGPTRKSATAWGSPTVAESPILWNSPATSASLSRATLSCAPRSVSASSWISSMTTHSTALRCWMSLLPVNSTCRVSGVVMSISGGALDWACLSAWEVSPCLTPTVTPRAFP